MNTERDCILSLLAIVAILAITMRVLRAIVPARAYYPACFAAVVAFVVVLILATNWMERR